MLNIAALQKKYSDWLAPDFEILLAHAIAKPKEFLFTHPEYRPTTLKRLRLAYFLYLKKLGWSVANITHHKEFYGLDFYVNRHTLIPRPETELMVEEVVKRIWTTDYRLQTTAQPSRSPSTVVLIDVGTGTGCIPISIIKTLKQENIKTIATDISRSTLRVARRNARTHKVFINFLHGNLLEPIARNYELLAMNYELVIITANLPYLTAEQFAAEPSIQREPRTALVGGKDGLTLYEELLQQIKRLTDYGLRTTAQPSRSLSAVVCSLVVFFEIDPSQSHPITTLIKNYLPQTIIEIKKDLAGRDRLVVVELNS